TGEQVLTSTRRAMNSSAANQARQHNPAAAPGIAHHPKDHHGRGTRSALRTGRTNTIAYVCLDAANPFLTDVTRGIEAAMEATSAAVFLCNSDENTARESRYLDMLEQQRVRGILITPIDPTSDRLRALPRRGTPVVVVDRVVPSNELCSVSVDDVLGGELGVAHLIANGHERIGFVGGPMLLGQMIDRLAGARRALSIAAKNPDGIIMIETDAPTIKDGREAGACIAGMPPAQRPTAVLCANDLLALGLLTEALQLGLNVPDDLAIVGYDDIEFTAAAAVPLTSVRQPRHQLGLSAGQLLLEELAGEEHVHQQIELSPELVVRASTTVKPPAGSSPATRAT
ncbi:MAG TPA: substrate-binding domain-containing protein, partial [Jiangellaceae bacterium]|nr:substrate-binding domain-containing protein [Jiangellaceae bacterium]